MKTFALIADSLGLSVGYGVRPSRHWLHLLQLKLQALEYDVQGRNFGVGSNTTGYDGSVNAGHMLDRLPVIFDAEVPKWLFIQGGVNDGAPWTYTEGNLRGLALMAKHGATGAVAGQASLPRGAIPGTRYLVRVDSSTTGGLALPSGAPGTARIDGTVTGSAPAIWEARFGAAGEAGWGRVAVSATPATYVTRVAFLGFHYLNYSASYPTQRDFTDPGTPANDTDYAPYDAVTGLRSKQIAAATAEGALYIDLHGYERARIRAGLETQGSFSTLISDYSAPGGSLHPNDHGHSVTAQCVLETILAQPTWLALLTN